MIRLTFLGAAQTVTGSKYLLEAADANVLIDCGMFQGLKELREKNWAPFPFKVNKLDAIVLTHAHLDHVGMLPRIVKQGFRGKVVCTPATAELTEITLFDSAKIQESDANYANRKGFSKHIPAYPLYDSRDVEQTIKLFRTVPRNDWFSPVEPFWMRYHDAGHLLGSNMIEVEVRQGAKPLRILFSGDVGRYDGPLYHDPASPPQCDYLVCESTYGNRDHAEGDLSAALAEVVTRSVARGGVMLVAAFAIGRAQQLIYLLQLLRKAGRIPDFPIYLDSPMAVDATNIYREHDEDHDLSEGQLDSQHPLFGGPRVLMCRRTEESKALNRHRGPAMIISSSGMMTGGRIVHHLKNRLDDPENTIILGGYMAEGTRGRLLQDGAKSLRMHGQDVSVRAAIETVPGLSGHADRKGLLRWLAPLEPPQKTFLTHGELDVMQAFAAELTASRGWNVQLPALGETQELA